MAQDVTTPAAATEPGHRSLAAEVRKSLGGNFRQYGMLIALLLGSTWTCANEATKDPFSVAHASPTPAFC